MADTEAERKEQTEGETEAKCDDEWKAEKYRNKVIERIEDEIAKTESTVPKSASELEEFVFNKSNSRKDYLDFVAKLLIYITEFNKKKNSEAEKKDEEKEETAES